MRLLTSILAALLLTTCAANLGRVKKKNTIPGRSLDFSKVFFLDLETNEQTSVAAYMAKNNREYMLLMFGSVGCLSCNKKAKEISQNYLTSHALFLEKDEKRFDFLGVNTDSGSARDRFNLIWQDDDSRADKGYEFVKWADPKGEAMRTFFLEEGESFGVPFTIMISRTQIMWRYTNDESYTIKGLLKRIEDTLAGRDTGPGDDEDQKDKGKDYSTLLSFESPSRFSNVRASTCSGAAASLQNVLNSAELNFVQIDKGTCAPGTSCSQNDTQFQELAKSCGSRCSFTTLTLDKPDAAVCARAYQGGKEFYDVFTTHYQWAYDPIFKKPDMGGSITGLSPVSGPMVLGFRANGKMIFSGEGALPASGAGSIAALLSSAADTRPRGIDYEVFGDLFDDYSPRDTNLAALRQRSRFTVVVSVDIDCGACKEELKHWSDFSHESPLKLCQDDPSFCNMYMLESMLAFPNDANGRKAFYDQIKGKFSEESITFPLLIEKQHIGRDRYSRISEAFLEPITKGPATVIFDNEGKILATFPSVGPQSPDPVLETLKKYRKEVQ